MKTYKMVVDKPYTLKLGYLGENEVLQVAFDYGAWISKYGDGSLLLVVKRNGDSLGYPVLLEEQDERTAVWTVKNTDVAKIGKGEAQLEYVVDEAIKKSSIFEFEVENSLADEGEAPEPYESFLDQVIEVSAQALEYKNDAKKSASEASDYATESAKQAGLSADSASEASGYAQNASSSASSASESAETAGRYADSAQASAEQAEQSVLMGGYINADIVDGHLIITYVNIDNLEFSLVDGRLMVNYGD